VASQDWIEKDFYKELGVDKTADEATIKKAYRKLARKYHPDQNAGDKAAEAKFKSVAAAYAVLSDKEQRSEYDQVRAYAGGGARFTGGSQGSSAGGYEDLFGGMNFGTSSYPRRRSTGAFEGINLDDLFGFGGSSFDSQFNRYEEQIRNPGSTGARTTLNRPGEDIKAEITLPLRTAVEGDTVELSVAGRTVKTRVPAGTKDGATLKLRGKGYGSPGDGPNGDLLLTVHVSKHPVYTMSGRNLRLTVPVTFAEAALGAIVDVPKLDGSTVKVRIPAGTPNGRTLRVPNAGVETSAGTGALLVTVSVQVPENLNETAKQALTDFEKAVGEQNVREQLIADARK
jgi:molecular chaperone DnaJ